MNTAYFVKNPRTLNNLQVPHLLSVERPYKIVADVVLAAIDYENFITDMVADRQFITDNSGLCSEGDPMKCIYGSNKKERLVWRVK